jgi:1-acyl-sn-glycerol-3-phosphate acyltransferase
MAKRKKKIKRPGFIYVLLGALLVVYAVCFKRHRVIKNLPKGLKPPYIIVGNHTSFYDFVYAFRSVYPERINFVVARKYFHYSGLSLIMRLSRAIPKSLYQPDTGTIMGILTVLKQGGIIGIFPEGQIATSGITLDNGETIAKLVKKAEVPVVSVLTAGAYFSNPPWAKNGRRGRGESRAELILTRDQVKDLPADAVMDRIRRSIYLDSYKWQKSKAYLYKGKNLASGLENVLYICPHCYKEFDIETEGDTIICQSCGTKVSYGEDGHLYWKEKAYFKHLGDWLNWQLEQERALVLKNEAYTITEPVELAMLKVRGRGTELVGRGSFTADRHNYTYRGTLKGETVAMTFHTAATRYLPFDTGRNFQIYNKDLLYEFRPDNPKWCVKIANLCEVFFSLNERK